MLMEFPLGVRWRRLTIRPSFIIWDMAISTAWEGRLWSWDTVSTTFRKVRVASPYRWNIRSYYRALENGRRSASLELLVAMSLTFEASLDYLILGRMKSSDSQRIQQELERIMALVARLKDSI